MPEHPTPRRADAVADRPGRSRRPLPALGGPAALLLLAAALLGLALPGRGEEPGAAGGEREGTPTGAQPLRFGQPEEEVERKSAGCRSCHLQTDSASMHASPAVHIGCTDCHGGDAQVRVEPGLAPGASAYEAAKRKAHPRPRYPEAWRTAANPKQSYTLLNRESPEWIRFVNPSDLRVTDRTCGTSGCHESDAYNVRHSMMAHGAMLWNAALYNNGAIPSKRALFGEAYTSDGKPARLQTIPPPTEEETRKLGILPYLNPLPRWEVTQPGNILRVFERGGVKRPDLGLQDPIDLPGEPEVKLSNRGLGTLLRTDPVFLGLQKTRLLDPMLWFLGTNEQPGDYRSSGCAACHVVYANDRDPAHSATWASFGNRGQSATVDPTIPRAEPGHPVRHVFTRAIPTSQCIVCHIHPGTTVTNSYLGTIWWDNETDGEHLYEPDPGSLSDGEIDEIQRRNPERAALRGRWGRDPEFLAQLGTPEFNAKLDDVQFADFHGHGWVFRKVFKRDRQGNLLDAEGKRIDDQDPQKFARAVHLKDIHLERGMHCIDCHFKQDNHGNGKLYGEVRNAVEVGCEDCHGTVRARATLVTSGPAALGGNDLQALRNPDGQRRFVWRGGRLYQRSVVTPGLEWEVVQVLDTITPGDPQYNERSRLAKTVRKDGVTWGDVPPGEGPKERGQADDELAHSDQRMACFACHTSWTTSCFGCHLPMTANNKKEMLHFEGEELRNWTSYNYQTLRDDVYMLGVDGTVTGNRIAPVRSTCAVLVGSQNANREWIYSQQQTISAEGFSGQAMSTFVPHTVRGRETKTCTDCHVSERNDNNALLAQLVTQGTNFYNFIGRYCYVATGPGGYEAVVVTEREEPQAVIGSHLHKLAYPKEYAAHEARGHELNEAYHHAADDVGTFLGKGAEVLGLQLRGEYVYAATGTGGLRIFDVANIDNKGFSERMLSAPVSPLGQRLYVRTRYATAVAAPATVALDPLRQRFPENEEQPIHLSYGFIYVTDRHEGLVLVLAATLLDGNPSNNFFHEKDKVVKGVPGVIRFNPGGVLDGAAHLTVAGTHVYVACDRGLVVVDVDNPLEPKVVAEVGAPAIFRPRAVQVQFRYAFVTDAEGLKVVDVTDPRRPRALPEATLRFPDARNLYLVRTYAYVAAGREGLAIVDITNPERPVLDQTWNAGGKLHDTRDVKTGMTNNGLFAYIADGEGGLKVAQLVTTGETPGWAGFSPRPQPRLVAEYHTHEPALAVSEGLDRDRGADESGNQVVVFNRVGARPFKKTEMERLYLRDGKLWTVKDDPPGAPRKPEPARSASR